ncbi:MAG: CsgG/HfaB family protein [Elusimicrobiota bacterium]
MKKRVNRNALIAITVLVLTVAFNCDSHAAVNYLNLEMSARGAGMADGGFTAIGDQLSGINCNPANAAFLTRIEGYVMDNLYLSEINYLILNGLFPTGLANFHAMFMQLNTPVDKVTDLNGNDLTDTVQYTGNVMGFGISKSVGQYFGLGTNIKFAKQDMKLTTSSTGQKPGLDLMSPAIDAGLLFRSGGQAEDTGALSFRLGAAVLNLGTEKDMAIRAGIGLKVAGLSLGADMKSMISGGVTQFSAGAEYWVVNMLGLRGGARITPTSIVPSVGIGFKLHEFELDYAFTNYSDGLGATHMIGFTGWIGGGTAAKTGEAQKPDTKTAGKQMVVEPQQVVQPIQPMDIKPEDKINVAVADLTGQNVSSMEAATIADFLRGELINSGMFNVIERSNMDKILAEQGFQNTGCTTQECAIKMGRLLNVQSILVGSFSKLMEIYYINVRLVDVEQGLAVMAESVKCKSAEELQDAVAQLSQKIMQRIIQNRKKQ